MKPPIIIISGPTAVGKTAVINLVLKKMPQLQTAITYTTRASRPGQKEDKKMIHVSEKDFKNKIQQEQLLEWAKFNNNYYGTAKKSLTAAGSKPLLLNIEIKGSLIIKRRYPEALLIFIRPDSMQQIRQRLIKRGLSPAQLRRRYHEAQTAMKQSRHFHYQIVNHEGRLNQTANTVCRCIRVYLKKQAAVNKVDK